MICLDRDGVLNAMLDRPGEPKPDSPMNAAEVKLLPGVPEALARLTARGYALAICTNQPAAAKGKARRSELERAHERVLDLAQAQGAKIRSSHICWHRAEDACSCRKPKPGLLLEALNGVSDQERAVSWMVGDREIDVLAGRAAGVKTALLAPRDTVLQAGLTPDFWGTTLADFTDYLLGICSETSP